ncbi:penicillin binding transpeptidase domain protein [Neorickettsia helminthoeca str. Oregon]|uniref:Penicillin binding transpeptidase domain protein n=1 Tax=Neorickettsia helminthoeca str. Oregon TaxID=1286528 RepID=X5HJL4_9RICK|nr:penicillin-binding protein 2 [Neorickettsia helminthoeca]AHX11284.1 penicillin binding transpeptidase domain protein [Neorickettsia helminthoeca str. Oregon]
MKWKKIAKRKLLLVKLIMGTYFLIVCGTLFSRCIIKLEVNKANFSNKVEYPPVLYDRNGEIIAFNLPTVSVYTFVKKLRGDHSEISTKLAEALLNTSRQELMKKFASTEGFVWLKRYLTPNELHRILLLGMPGLYFREEHKRVYISRNLFAHVLGYVDNDNLGIAGFEYYLHSKKNPQTYKDGVHLSLDSRVQAVLRSAMQEAIERFDAIGAAGIVMDANTGEVIALVSLPDFDPNHVQLSREEERFNRVSLGRYEFGSIMKIFTVACAMENGVISGEDTYDVVTPLKISGYTIKDLYKARKSIYNVAEILKYSSNVGMAQIAMKMGSEVQYNCFQELGFFDDIKFEIPEKSIPSRPKESRLTSVTLSYGYGFTPTLLHVMKATAILINDTGCLPTITLLKGNKENNTCIPVIREEVRKEMRKFMRGVVLDGSGRRADAVGYQVGGKTGSSEKNINGIYLKDKNLASFVAVFPMENPRYVIGISVDEPKSSRAVTGGVVSAPIAKKVIMYMAPLMNIKPVNDIKRLRS